MREGLLAPYEIPYGGDALEHVASPALDDDAIRRYWYEPTSAGKALWEHWDPPDPGEFERTRVFHFFREPRGADFAAVLRYAIGPSARLLLLVRDPENLKPSALAVLAQLQTAAVETRHASEWPGTFLPEGDTAAVHFFDYGPDVAEILISHAGAMYDWVEPALPEGPCLLREDGSPWLVTIPRERHSYLELSLEEHRAVVAALPTVDLRGPTNSAT